MLLVMFSLVLVILAGCGTASEGISSNTTKPSPSNNPTQDIDHDASKKEEYLKKLNDMDESDKNADTGITTIEMSEHFAEIYKKWDVELNEIYEVLKSQLSTQQMEKLKEEQRNWIKNRDIIAKEASLKFQGGTMESLEYIATLAGLTKERCYELVENYMK